MSTPEVPSLYAALIVAGGAFLGSLVGNGTSGLLARWTQRDQIRAAQEAANEQDRRALRDGSAGRLRSSYSSIIEAMVEFVDTPESDRTRIMSRVVALVDREACVISLEPHGQEMYDAINRIVKDMVDGIRTDTWVELTTRAGSHLRLVAAEHIGRLQEPIPDIALKRK